MMTIFIVFNIFVLLFFFFLTLLYSFKHDYSLRSLFFLFSHFFFPYLGHLIIFFLGYFSNFVFFLIPLKLNICNGSIKSNTPLYGLTYYYNYVDKGPRSQGPHAPRIILGPFGMTPRAPKPLQVQ